MSHHYSGGETNQVLAKLGVKHMTEGHRSHNPSEDGLPSMGTSREDFSEVLCYEVPQNALNIVFSKDTPISAPLPMFDNTLVTSCP
jgi:hypothetical protein